MLRNRVFFPQAALDQWQAVRVLAEVTGGLDIHEITGKVKTVAYLTELGAELLGTSMVLADLAYEVIPGFLGTPIGSFEDHRAGGGAPSSTSDEELLAQYLIRNL
jgi:hypothetical protein